MGFNVTREITIYDKMKESDPAATKSTAVIDLSSPGARERRVRPSPAVEASDIYRSSTFGETDVRLFKGFSFNFYGEYDKITDQISA